MISCLFIYREIVAAERVDAWLERDGERLPLQRVLAEIEPVDAGAPDEQTLATIAGVLATIAPTIAALERAAEAFRTAPARSSGSSRFSGSS